MTPPVPATLTVVGDVHRHWRRADSVHLERSDHEMALFVGDLGDEDVEMVRTIAAIATPKAVVLGNHDAWQSFSHKVPTPKLREILDLLGDDHIAYCVREAPRAGVSIIGARPFSWGGPNLRSPELYDQIYGIHTMRQSAAAIVEAARNAQHRDLVILAHNGPLGLSAVPQDIYGKDFGKPGGDWGDRDLALALQRIEDMGLRVRAVVAGHMHHKLVHPAGSERLRFVRRGDTLFLNPACVPRVRLVEGGTEISYFLRLHWQAGRCIGIEESWVNVHGDACARSTPEVVELPPAEPIAEHGE